MEQGATAVVVLDVHGALNPDGAVTHEPHLESRHGINPLVLSLDPKGGGLVVQKEIVRTRLQRPFAPLGRVSSGFSMIRRVRPMQPPRESIEVRALVFFAPEKKDAEQVAVTA